MSFKEKIAYSLSTFFTFKVIAYMNGTVGSVIGVIIGVILLNYIPLTGIFFILILLSILGIWASNIYISVTKENDPGEVIIDEVIGQILTLTIFYIYTKNLDLEGIILCFIYFRIFDIIKPPPISWIDKNCKGAIGILLDDLVAAIIAGIFSILSIIFYNYYV